MAQFLMENFALNYLVYLDNFDQGKLGTSPDLPGRKKFRLEKLCQVTIFLSRIGPMLSTFSCGHCIVVIYREDSLLLAIRILKRDNTSIYGYSCPSYILNM